jgi:DNA-binding transcriptional ArsR family regulator
VPGPDTPDQSPPQPPRTEVTLDARNLRGIAHPVRVRMLALLRDQGPSTATRLAASLGLNSGATSYHLRQLETYGFVTEDTELGTARERWWRAAHQSTLLDPGDVFTGDSAELGETYLRAVAAFAADSMQRAIDEWKSVPPEWQGIGTISDYALRLTPEELDGVLQQIFTILDGARPHDAADAPPGSRRTTVQLQAFLQPGASERDPTP